MASRKNKEASRKRAPKAYKLPDPISKGEVMIDTSKQQWIVGESIGIGGFGEIYSGILSLYYIILIILVYF